MKTSKPSELFLKLADGNALLAEFIRQDLLLDHPKSFPTLYNEGSAEMCIGLNELINTAWLARLTFRGDVAAEEFQTALAAGISRAVEELSVASLKAKKPHDRKCYKSAIISMRHANEKNYETGTFSGKRGFPWANGYSSETKTLDITPTKAGEISFISREEAQTLTPEEILAKINARLLA